MSLGKTLRGCQNSSRSGKPFSYSHSRKTRHRSIINKKLLTASRIFQLLLDEDSSNVKCLAMSDAEVAELIVKEDAPITHKPIKDLNLPRDITLGGLIRDGKAMIVNGNTQIQANDHVMVFV